jgi:hypothetical protein
MLCPSHVDALRIHTQGLPGSILGVAYPEKIGSGVTEQWIRANCPCAYEDNKQVVFLPKLVQECTECLPLNITYSQRDSRWAADVLGQNTGHDKTIGNYGCLLTAYNMQAVFLGLTTDTPRQFNIRMRNAGAFSGPYLNPGALANAFPTQIQYNGYLSRGETLNNRIKSYIDTGYPVPVEVDFRPETAQWDQHWVLVIGYNADDFYIVDPWHGDKLWLSTRYNISGNDILQGVFYTRRTTTPGYVYNGPAVTFRPLIESPADDWRWPVVKGMIDSVNIGVKFKSHGSNADYYNQYSGRHDFLPVRLFFSATNYVSPEILYRDTWKGQIQNFYNRGARDFELFNEPNIEGVGTFWNNGTEYANYMLPICIWMQADFPGIRIWFTAMSPGVPFTNQYTWIDTAWPILAPFCFGFCTHAYSGNNADVNVATNEILTQIQATRERYNLQKPLFLSECSVNRGTNYFQKAQVYRTLEERFNTMNGIKAVSYFISDWYSPPPSQQDHGESWYGTDLPTYYKTL